MVLGHPLIEVKDREVKLTVIIPSIIPLSALEGACSRSMAHFSTTEAT